MPFYWDRLMSEMIGGSDLAADDYEREAEECDLAAEEYEACAAKYASAAAGFFTSVEEAEATRTEGARQVRSMAAGARARAAECRQLAQVYRASPDENDKAIRRDGGLLGWLRGW